MLPCSVEQENKPQATSEWLSGGFDGGSLWYVFYLVYDENFVYTPKPIRYPMNQQKKSLSKIISDGSLIICFSGVER